MVGINVRAKGVRIVRISNRENDGNGIPFWATDFLKKKKRKTSDMIFKIELCPKNLKQYLGVRPVRLGKHELRLDISFLQS
ncbi:hypothetical protein J2128_001939 [Methanomicrobium sp. W14]|uniref:hypothetical protein n=1 Tax=Methanomicrobium sp. W14 TaxID=2817839 RepID=UPI001AE63840|nr:hypothetical protein [Methanomicrobium sp. W14]MBP2133973.1 hypothetical protein [Methanomicrobium sp. W14]